LLVFFLKTDSLTFGSGLVNVPFLEKDLVQQTGWLNGSEFLVACFWGSLVSTIEIFLPSLFLIVAVAPILFRHRANPNVRASSRGPMPLRSARSSARACRPAGSLGDWLTALIAADGLAALLP
jgi:chromate transporter